MPLCGRPHPSCRGTVQRRGAVALLLLLQLMQRLRLQQTHSRHLIRSLLTCRQEPQLRAQGYSCRWQSPRPGTSSKIVLRVLPSTPGSMTLAVCHEGHPSTSGVTRGFKASVASIGMPCTAGCSRLRPLAHLGVPGAAVAVAAAPARLALEGRGAPATAAAAADSAAGGKQEMGAQKALGSEAAWKRPPSTAGGAC